MEKIMEILKTFDPIEKDGYVEVNLPILMHMYGSHARIRIFPKDGGYLITDFKDTFDECNEKPSYYYDLFIKNDKHYHYDILLANTVIYKIYPEYTNLYIAIDEFIRFFVDLDNFMIDNNHC